MAASSKLRFGIIGCGSIGPTHAAALTRIPNTQLVAVADLVETRALQMSEKFNVDRVHRDGRELIADPNVDVVICCTPSGMHADHAIAALRAGKHAIVEKPMDVSLDACQRLIAEVEASKRTFTVISQHRFDKATSRVRSALVEGQLGQLVLATASVKWWRTQGYYDSGDWRGTWKLDGGGALMNQGVHTVDLLQWLAGGVTHVFARTATAAHQRIEVEDIAVATLRFRNGAIGNLLATTAAYPGFPARIDLYGTEGSAIIEGDKLHTLSLKSGQQIARQRASAHAVSVAMGGTASVKDQASQRVEAEEEGEVWGDAHRAQLTDFVDAVRNNRPPLIDARAGLDPLKIIFAVYESARTGREIAIQA